MRNAPYLAQVDIGRQIDLKQAATLAGLSLEKLKQLNPGYNRLKTDPDGPFKLILPIEHVQQFTENLSQSPRFRNLNWIQYRIKSGDTLTTIARRFNVSPVLLRKQNPILLSHFKPGIQLMIPHVPPAISKTVLEEEQQHYATSNQHLVMNKKSLSTKISHALENLHGSYAMQPGDTLYIVRQGDDLNKVAARFHISAKSLMTVNHLTNPALHPGRSMIIPTHVHTADLQKYHLTPGDTIYMVRQGDTLEKVAAKFHTTTAALRLVNLLSDNSVTEGDRLVIPTHV